MKTQSFAFLAGCSAAVAIQKVQSTAVTNSEACLGFSNGLPFIKSALEQEREIVSLADNSSTGKKCQDCKNDKDKKGNDGDFGNYKECYVYEPCPPPCKKKGNGRDDSDDDHEMIEDDLEIGGFKG